MGKLCYKCAHDGCCEGLPYCGGRCFVPDRDPEEEEPEEEQEDDREYEGEEP